jgi:hypothetical protein
MLLDFGAMLFGWLATFSLGGLSAVLAGSSMIFLVGLE